MFITHLIIMIMLTMVIFLLTDAPLKMALVLLIQSIFFFLLFGLFTSSWYGMMILLIFSGGMMIIFLYMTSLCSNFKFNWSLNSLPIIFFLLIMLMKTENFLNEIVYSHNFSLVTMYSIKNFFFFFIITLYLIMSLVLVVSMSQYFLGSLKKTY